MRVNDPIAIRSPLNPGLAVLILNAKRQMPPRAVIVAAIAWDQRAGEGPEDENQRRIGPVGPGGTLGRLLYFHAHRRTRTGPVRSWFLAGSNRGPVPAAVSAGACRYSRTKDALEKAGDGGNPEFCYSIFSARFRNAFSKRWICINY